MRGPGLAQTLVNVRNLAVEFRSAARVNRAVKGVSFSIGKGETVALVGESGSGKTVIGAVDHAPVALSRPRITRPARSFSRAATC